MVLDVYVWPSYRLHALKTDTPVSWHALQAQFGIGFRNIRAFRQHFKQCLGLALAAYPDARVSMDNRGLVLRPSRSPIAAA